MTKDLMTDAVLREFLLDRLNDAEREEIEDLFLTDPQAKDRVLIAEQDLIEDYLEDNLTEADKERFLALHAQTGEQTEKLLNTKSIKDWALSGQRLSQTATAGRGATLSIWHRFSKRLGVKPIYLVPIAVTIVIAIVLAIVWGNSRIEQRKHLAVEQELAQLNSPTSLRETPPAMISLELEPGTVRGVEPQPEFQLRAGTQTVELRLRWTPRERYSTYQAEVRNVGDDKSFTLRNLQPDNNNILRNNDIAHAIRLRLPTHILRRGHYTIRLTGITPDGNPALTQEYNFAVGS
jgi:hypothetical protein